MPAMPMDVTDGEAPADIITAIWAMWLLSWLIASAWAGRTQAAPARGSQLPYRLVTIVGAACLFARSRLFGLPLQTVSPLWSFPPLVSGAMIILTAAGFGVCWWARLHLGRLWSSSVTRKEDHHIVATGPYRFARHPIYTGIILASVATALEQGTALALVGSGLIAAGCWMKARLEERFLRLELGADAYDAYAARTGMLFPYL